MKLKKKGTNDWGIVTKKNKKTGKEEIFARIVRTDGSGKPKQYARKAESKVEARRLRDALVREFDRDGEEAIKGSKLLFRDLCDIYETKKVQKAEYLGEGKNKRKIKGKRSIKPSLAYLKVLKDYFGAKLVRKLSHDDVEEFKKVRLWTKTIHGAERSVVDVNRSLEHLRAILRFAKGKGWLNRTPFDDSANPLISKAEENTRDRTLSAKEQERLLEACTGRRSHLKPIIITALDTAMRRGELFKLRWRDVDFENGIITIVATNSKVERERKVPMTPNVQSELTAMWNASTKDREALVFGIKDTIKTAFASACEKAGLKDLRFHDFRHTAISRMIAAGQSPVVVQLISGHTQYKTFMGYVNPDTMSLATVATALAKYNQANASAEEKQRENGDLQAVENVIEADTSVNI
jgi:integrase